MRIFITDRDTLQPADLQAKVFRAGVADNTALDQLRKLNPQVDFTRLAEGTVLLLPDTPEIAAGAGKTAGSDNFGDLATDLTRSLEATSENIRKRLDRGMAEQKALTATLKPAAVSAQVKADPELLKQIEAAADRARADGKKAADNLKALQQAHQQAQKELAELAKLFG
jgi:hypothetical protein